MFPHISKSFLGVSALRYGNRITLEHSLKHHFGKQPFSPHFGTQNANPNQMAISWGNNWNAWVGVREI
jgi:hypothetical protein